VAPRAGLSPASKVNGTSVYNPAGEKLGSIYDVMLEKVSGRAEFAILSFGGFLGIGEKYFPLPWNALNYDVAQGGYVVNVDRDRLERAPSYSADELSGWDDTWDSRITDYWRAPV
jgi:hypothetical protein